MIGCIVLGDGDETNPGGLVMKNSYRNRWFSKQIGKCILLVQRVGEIALDWSSDAVEEYTCTWAYDYWTHGQEETKSVVSDPEISF